MLPIPKKTREAQNKDPEFEGCMLRAHSGHVCGGRPNTRSHPIIVAGRRLQKPWAIISACAKGHGVDEFQDAGYEHDLHMWVALNRATDQELLEISKAVNYKYYRDRLNALFGPYKPVESVYKNI